MVFARSFVAMVRMVVGVIVHRQVVVISQPVRIMVVVCILA